MIRNGKIIGIIVSLVVSGMLTSCAPSQSQVPPVLIDPPSSIVEEAIVYRGDLSEIYLYDGWVEPDVDELSFDKGGVLAKIRVSIGDAVKEGDVIANLENEELTSRLKLLTEELERQKDNYAYNLTLIDYDIQLAELEYNSTNNQGVEKNETEKSLQIVRLKKKHLIEERDLKLKQLEDKIIKLKQEEEQLTLKASASGTVVYTNYRQLNNSIEAGTVVVGIGKEDLYLRSQYIDPQHLQNASNLYALIGKEKLELKEIPYTEEELLVLKAQKEELKSTFAIDSNQVKSGDYGCIVLETSIKEEALIIPIEAVHKDAFGSEYVNMVEGGGKTKRNIKTGLKDMQMIEVLEGLEEGDIVTLNSPRKDLQEEGEEYLIAQKGTYTEEFSISGLESMYLEYDFISLQEEGEFLRYRKEMGEEVKKGEILAEYTISYDDIQIEESRLNYNRILDNYKEEKEKRKRKLEDLEDSIKKVKEDSYDKQKQELILQVEKVKYKQYCKEAERSLEAHKRSLEELENMTKIQYIYATMDGVIQNRQPLSLGDSLAANQELIYLLNPDSYVWIVNNVSQNLKYNMQFQIENPLGNREDSYTGIITSADNIISKKAQTSLAYIRLTEGQAEDEIHGNTALLKAVTKRVEDAVILESNNILLEDKSGLYVYISHKNGVEKRPVLAKEGTGKLWIYKGLFEGEKVRKIDTTFDEE